MAIVSVPSSVTPTGSVCGFVTAGDGVRLRVARWHPEGPARGTVCILHGRTEYIEKYAEIVAGLLARGYAVATLDWRSQGLSDRTLPGGNLCHVERFADYGVDLDALVAEVLPLCPPPYTVLAHSMGGLIALNAVREGHAPFDRLVLVAPMLSLSPRTAPRMALVRLITTVALFLGLDAKPLPRRYIPQPASVDPEEDQLRLGRHADHLAAEPRFAVGDPTVRWLHESALAMKRASTADFALGIDVPVLLLTGDRELVVSLPAIQLLATGLGTTPVNVPGSRHELLMEPDVLRQQFWAAFEAFMPG